jgi:O-6-methylguanine DNA methyltransferase
MLTLPGIGDLWLVWSDEGLVMLSLPHRAPGEVESDMVDRGLAPPPLLDVPAAYAEPLLAYAAGDAIDPASLPVDLRGTDFQVRVWQALRRIPRGETRTYREVARAIGAPRAVRAVGSACAANPVALAVPCHRVLRADGALGGYAWGLGRKQRLLEIEKLKRK